MRIQMVLRTSKVKVSNRQRNATKTVMRSGVFTRACLVSNNLALRSWIFVYVSYIPMRIQKELKSKSGSILFNKRDQQ